MLALVQSCARSSLEAMFGFFLMCAPLLLGQNTISGGTNKELPDAPIPVTTATPAQSHWNFTHSALLGSSDANRTQTNSWMGTSAPIERPAFNTNALAPKERSRFDGKDMKVAGRSPAHLFSFDPIGSHTNREVTHSGNQWYTSHIPLAGSIMRQGLKISKAHPHITTVIKTIKPKL